MIDGGTVLALDMASTCGVAWGTPGGVPRSTSIQFAPAGSTHAAVGGAALQWLSKFYTENKPSVIVIERPGLHSVAGGKTSFDVIYRLLGLIFVAQSVAYLRGCYDTRLVRVDQIRKHFIGSGGIKGGAAKLCVQERCSALGWEWKTGDEADALALWAWGCEQLKPGTGHEFAPHMIFVDSEGAEVGQRVKAPRPRREKLTSRQAQRRLALRGML